MDDDKEKLMYAMISLAEEQWFALLPYLRREGFTDEQIQVLSEQDLRKIVGLS